MSSKKELFSYQSVRQNKISGLVSVYIKNAIQLAKVASSLQRGPEHTNTAGALRPTFLASLLALFSSGVSKAFATTFSFLPTKGDRKEA